MSSIISKKNYMKTNSYRIFLCNISFPPFLHPHLPCSKQPCPCVVEIISSQESLSANLPTNHSPVKVPRAHWFMTLPCPALQWFLPTYQMKNKVLNFQGQLLLVPTNFLWVLCLLRPLSQQPCRGTSYSVWSWLS